VLGCKQRGEASPSPEASARSHLENPKAYPRERLTRSLEATEARFRGLGALPDCKPLVTEVAARARCTDAANAVTARAAARAVPDAERMRLAADVALTSQRAAEALRERGVARLLESRPEASPSARPSASPSAATPPPRASVAKPRPLPAPSASAARAAAREQSDPDLDAIVGYSRVVTIGLAELRAYLEFGDVTLRGAALNEVARLSREQPHWAALRALLDEAYLVESNPALKSRLKALQSQLGVH